MIFIEITVSNVSLEMYKGSVYSDENHQAAVYFKNNVYDLTMILTAFF